MLYSNESPFIVSVQPRLYPNESPFIVSVQPHIDTFEIAREVERVFVESVGQEEVVEVYANQYPSQIGVMLFLKHGKNADVIEFGDKIEDSFARQGLNVSLLILPVSAMKGYPAAEEVRSVVLPKL